VQLVLENAPAAEIEEVLSLCKSVGLPICLADIGVVDATREKVERVAAAACAKEETIHNMPFAVTPEDVVSSIYVADKLGAMAK
jgi:glycerol dehydrogenase